LIGYDNYHTIAILDENVKFQAIFIKAVYVDNGKIAVRSIVAKRTTPRKKMFLADRFIKIDVLKCKAEDPYGDNCEVKCVLRLTRQ